MLAEMSARRLKCIALHVDSVGAYGRGVLSGIAAYARARPRWRLYIRGMHGAPELEDADMGGMDAAIVQDYEECALVPLFERGAPLVLAGSHRPSRPIPAVMQDNAAIARLAAEHLIERGLRHLVYFAQSTHGASDERARTFVEAAEAAGAQCWQYEATSADPAQSGRRKRSKGGQGSLPKWLGSLPRPLGVFTFNDVRAVAVIRAAQAAGLAVPDDVAVIGVDDDSLVAEQLELGLSSIQPNAWRIGYRAAEMLDSLLRGERFKPEYTECIPPLGVIARASTGTLAVEDEQVAAALRMVQQRFTDPQLQVADLLAGQPVSRRAFERRFFEAVDRTPAEHIRHVRLRRAQELLADVRMPLEQVATASGFSSARLLGVIFRRHMGISPQAYRRQCYGRT